MQRKDKIVLKKIIENPQIEWKKIAGFRDVIANKYDIIDMESVYDTIKYNFPELKAEIEKILEK